MLLREASDVDPGDGVGELADFSAQSDSVTPTSAAPAPSTAPNAAAAPADASSSLDSVQSWAGWLITALVALLVVAVATFSLLRR